MIQVDDMYTFLGPEDLSGKHCWSSLPCMGDWNVRGVTSSLFGALKLQLLIGLSVQALTT